MNIEFFLIVHPNMFPKAIVRIYVKLNEVKDNVKSNQVKDNVKPNGVNDDIKLDDVKPSVRPVIVKVNMCEHFTNKQEIIVHEHMLQWVRMEAVKTGFDVVIRIMV